MDWNCPKKIAFQPMARRKLNLNLIFEDTSSVRYLQEYFSTCDLNACSQAPPDLNHPKKSVKLSFQALGSHF